MVKGRHLRKKLPGGRELLDFSPWDGRMVPLMVQGTVMGTELQLVTNIWWLCQSFLPAFLSLGCRTLLSIAEIGGRILTKASSGRQGRLHRARSLSRRQEPPSQWEGAASQQLSETRPGLFFFQFVGMWVDFSPFFFSPALCRFHRDVGVCKFVSVEGRGKS